MHSTGRWAGGRGGNIWAAEDLFVLAADTGLSGIRVILSPLDFRADAPRTALPDEPAWVKHLYTEIEAELKQLPMPAQ